MSNEQGWSATEHAEYVAWYINKYGKKEPIPLNEKLVKEFRDDRKRNNG